MCPYERGWGATTVASQGVAVTNFTRDGGWGLAQAVFRDMRTNDAFHCRCLYKNTVADVRGVARGFIDSCPDGQLMARWEDFAASLNIGLTKEGCKHIPQGTSQTISHLFAPFYTTGQQTSIGWNYIGHPFQRV